MEFQSAAGVRDAIRSLVATATFMASGFMTVFVTRHLLGAEVGLLTALVSGLLFGIGLMVAGMANPAKVRLRRKQV